MNTQSLHPTTNDTIHLQLTIDDVNLILESLGDQPFRRVFQVIGRIQAAARAQIDAVDQDHGAMSPTVDGRNTDSQRSDAMVEAVRE